MSVNLEAILLEMLGQLAPGKSASPEEVARAADPDPETWRRLLPRVRAIAVGLAREGRLVILRHNKPADPDKFRGVYRLRLLQVEDKGAQ
jgi:hypothetical protein